MSPFLRLWTRWRLHFIDFFFFIESILFYLVCCRRRLRCCCCCWGFLGKIQKVLNNLLQFSAQFHSSTPLPINTSFTNTFLQDWTCSCTHTHTHPYKPSTLNAVVLDRFVWFKNKFKKIYKNKKLKTSTAITTTTNESTHGRLFGGSVLSVIRVCTLYSI